MAVLKEVIFKSSNFGKGVVVLRELICRSPTLGWCGGLERTDL